MPDVRFGSEADIRIEIEMPRFSPEGISIELTKIVIAISGGPKVFQDGVSMTFRNGADARQASVEAPDAGTASLTDTSINPATGLATDYLNRFNEAVMLLDMLSNCPEFRDDFLAWEPMSYGKSFRPVALQDSRYGDRRPDQADSNVRNTLDTLAVTMTIVLEATRAAMDRCRQLRRLQANRLAEAVDRARWRDHQR